MLRPGGYAVITTPEPGEVRLGGGPVQATQPGVTEFDTYQCGHCGGIRHVLPRQRPEDIGGFCRQCMRAVCPTCVETGRCDPLEK